MPQPLRKEFPNGLTVKELRELLAEWPDTDENGNDHTVWVESGYGTSSQVTDVWPLNARQGSADMLMEFGFGAGPKTKAGAHHARD